MSSLSARNLTYVYGQGTSLETVAVNNCSFDIEKGELIGIIGHTGSGKSTLIEHFNGLLKPTKGEIILDGINIGEKKEYIKQARFKVGLCFQYPEYQLFEETVYKDIAYGPKNMKLSKEETDRRIKECIGYVGLDTDCLDKSPFDLSGGQKRRVAIAGVMAMEPDILVLDEPTAGLDPRGRDDLFRIIGNYNKITKRTVIIVSHSMEDVAKIASKVLVMNKGEVAFFDKTENVFSHGEELIKMGLNVPQITKVFMKLKEEGYDVDANVFTVEDAVREILRAGRVLR